MTAISRHNPLREGLLWSKNYGWLIIFPIFIGWFLHIFGVTPQQLLIAIVYEAVFIFLPGQIWVALFLPSLRKLDARHVLVGWAAGYVAEILLFNLLAALNARWLLIVYPVVMILGAGSYLFIRRRTLIDSVRQFRIKPGAGWAVGAIFTVLLIYIGTLYYSLTPLPGAIPRAGYFNDIMLAMGNTALLKHVWPLTDPRMSGIPLSYYLFAYMHMASMNIVTGLELDLIVLRLYLIGPLLLSPCSLFVLGSRLSSRPLLTGAIAIGMLLVGEIDPFQQASLVFEYIFIEDIVYSPTFLFGLALFVPLLVWYRSLRDTGWTMARCVGGNGWWPHY